MTTLDEIGARAKAASAELNMLSEEKIDAALINAAAALERRAAEIIGENAVDVRDAENKGVAPALVDRLRLDEKRISQMAEGVRQVASLQSPVGESVYNYVKENGLKIEERRVPFGVIGIIYESRPNVTADAFALCFKTANAVILRGGSDALRSNLKIAEVLRGALQESGVAADAVRVIDDTSRETAEQFMRLDKYVDLLIPRGGAGLIKKVKDNATIPVIETGTGNCHIYVDEYADLNKAVEIIFNAKTQRYGVCNACESLVVHEKIAAKALPAIAAKLGEKQVEIRGDERARTICPDFTAAAEEDFAAEYLDAIISLKIVDDIDEAIAHINKYNTGHSEAIITENAANAEKFLHGVDAAVVYLNASTRFTDGFEFGMGAEIGISTQKLHARGPMGLKALTTTKFICLGNGQIRK